MRDKKKVILTAAILLLAVIVIGFLVYAFASGGDSKAQSAFLPKLSDRLAVYPPSHDAAFSGIQGTNVYNVAQASTGSDFELDFDSDTQKWVLNNVVLKNGKIYTYKETCGPYNCENLLAKCDGQTLFSYTCPTNSPVKNYPNLQVLLNTKGFCPKPLASFSVIPGSGSWVVRQCITSTGSMRSSSSGFEFWPTVEYSGTITIDSQGGQDAAPQYWVDPLVVISAKDNLVKYGSLGVKNTGTVYDVVMSDPRINWNKAYCALEKNATHSEFVASTTLDGGKSTSLAAISQLSTFKRFCISAPAVMTNDKNESLGTDTQIYYDLLTNAGGYVVPASKTFTIFWVSESDTQVFYKCEGDNWAYDAGKDACVPTSGFVYTCPSDKVREIENGVVYCYNQPAKYCKDGAEYNNVTKKCESPEIIDCQKYCVGKPGCTSNYDVDNGVGVCKTTPPEDKDCSDYGPNSHYDLFLDKCITTPPEKKSCDKYGSESYYDALSDFCLTPATNHRCTTGVYNATIDKCQDEPGLVHDCSSYPGTAYDERLKGCSKAAPLGTAADYCKEYVSPIAVSNGTHCYVPQETFSAPASYNCSAFGPNAFYNLTSKTCEASALNGSTRSNPLNSLTSDYVILVLFALFVLALVIVWKVKKRKG